MRSIVATLVASVLVALVLCEGLARLHERRACVAQNGGVNRYSRLLGWENRPGASLRAVGCNKAVTEYAVGVRVSSRGLRGREIPYERGGGARILALGDSFTAGMQVEEDETWTEILGARLRERRGGPVEVVNTGVNGWGTDNQRLYWRHEGFRYRPDLVLLAFDTTNDVFENQRRLVSLHAFWPDKPYFALEDGRLGLRGFPLPPLRRTRALPGDLASAAVARSALFRVLAATGLLPYQLFFLPPPAPPPDAVEGEVHDVFRADYPEAWTEAWRITRGLVLGLRDEVERRGSRFAVVVINTREEVAPPRWDLMVGMRPGLAGAALDRDKPNRLLVSFLRRRGIPTIELLPAFRERFPEGTPGFFAWNLHWAPPGHAFAAERIADAIEAQGLLDGK